MASMAEQYASQQQPPKAVAPSTPPPAAPVIPVAAPSMAEQFIAPKQPETPVSAQPETNVTDVSTDEPESLLKRSTRRAGQEILATPGGITGLYGLAGAAYDRYVNGVPWDEAMLSEDGRELIDKAASGNMAAQMSLEQNPTQILRTGLRAAADIYNWAGEQTGVTNNPDGSVPLDEEVGGIVGSTLLTLPAAIVTKPMSLAGMVSNRAVRTALKGSIRAAELVTPGTIGVGKYGSNIAANAAVQTVINDVARTLTDEQTLIGTMIGSDFTDEDTDEALAGQPLAEADEMLATAAGVGAVAAAAIGGPRFVQNIAQDAARAGRVRTSQGGETLGAMPVRDSAGNVVRDVAQDIQSAGFDQDNVLLEGLKRTGVTEASVNRFDDFMRANNGASTNVARDRFIMTGMLDDGSIKTDVPFVDLSAAYDKLDDVTRTRIDNYIEAVDELDRRSRGVVNMPNITDAQLRSRAAANGNANVRAFADKYFDIGRKFSDYRFKKNMIDSAQHASELSRKYMPNIELETPRKGAAGLFDRVKRFTTGSDDIGVAAFEKEATGGIEVKVPPMEAMRRYIDLQVREIAQNSVRRTYLEQMAGRRVTDFVGGRRLVSTNPTEGGTTVAVMKNGKEVKYAVGDPRIAHALKFNPSAVAGFGLNTTRKWFQKATTGNLNPLFAPVSLAYDAFAGMIGGRTGRVVTGMIDDRLARAGFSERARDLLAVLRPLDTMTVVGEGLVQGAVGRYHEIVMTHMIKRAAAMGQPITQGMADAASKTFINSKYGSMQMQGYTSNMMTEGLSQLNELQTSAFFRNMDNAVKRSPVMQVYIGALDTIRDAYRMGLYSRNYAHQQWINKMAGDPPTPTPAQQRKIVNHVREVGVDPTKRGASDSVNKIMSSLPYGNITIQSANHAVRNMMTNPGGRVAAMSLMSTAWVMREMMSDEAKEYHDTRTPDYRRNTSLTFEIPHDGEPFDPAKHLYHLPLGPEMGLIVNGTLDGLGAWMEEQKLGDPSTYDRVKSALFDMLVPGVPPLVQAGAAATDRGALDVSSALRGDSLFRQPTISQGVPEMRGMGQNDGYMTDKIHGIMSAMFGAFGRTIADSAEVLDSELAKPDVTFREGMDRALDVFTYGTVDKQRVGTLFSDAVIEKPRGTPLSNTAYTIQQFGDTAVQFARDLVPNFSEGPRDKDIPYDRAVSMIPEALSDPDLKQQAMMIKAFFSTPQIAHSMRDAGQLRTAYFNNRSNTSVSMDQKNTTLNRINDEMHKNFETVAQSYGDFEQTMRQRTGNPEWSLETFAEAARRDIYNED